jgi:YebC/PmpR family DNA-binding regulatory protein
MAVANAKGANMPKDNIERAIKKALESGSSAFYEPTYEGYAPGGIAVFVECTTDNLNRTISSIRSTFNKKGGNLATNGSVDFLFQRKGIFVISVDGRDIDEIELALIDGGAEDFDVDEAENEITITVAFEDFGNMQKAIEDLNIEPISATLERIPTNMTTLNVHDSKIALQLIEALEDDDDVQNVFHNLEMTDELAAALDEG